ncbi:MAG: hypothetical protein GWN01_15930 [Nitrosopumilaceae archaeon]|nr:hypothetical protein [Nitrosopumilaceae archaeon]NIU02326.1 hypothetical protein [Nitrosopumilaceae archaeon]NIU88781.1 hypothetical protein [Nitrosopumilaceae archaeon]NIV66908.1 hypothetical protein [Nitrosopumilaceae archaeon]NIX62927.1 hypothetical protein [Nitrosopumilaceae archaeon]
MVRALLIGLGAIPVILALMIAIPMITTPEVPTSASNPNDKIELEYTIHQLKRVSHGVTERVGSVQTEILDIDEDGQVTYRLVEEGYPQPDKEGKISQEKLRKLSALVKETGLIAIPSENFPVNDDVEEYQKSTLKITLNGRTKQIHWPEPNATEKFIPPIIIMIESELDSIMEQVRE